MRVRSRKRQPGTNHIARPPVGKAITVAASEGVIGSVNPAAERVFAYESLELVGKNVKILMPESHAGQHDGYLARYIRTGDLRRI